MLELYRRRRAIELVFSHNNEMKKSTYINSKMLTKTPLFFDETPVIDTIFPRDNGKFRFLTTNSHSSWKNFNSMNTKRIATNLFLPHCGKAELHMTGAYKELQGNNLQFSNLTERICKDSLVSKLR